MTRAAITFDLFQAAFESEHYPYLFTGKETNEPALRLIGQLVAHTQDRAFIKSIVTSALPDDYQGDTLQEVDGMVDRAIKKGFADREMNADKKENPPSGASLLLLAAEQADVELFHDNLNAPYISVSLKGNGRKTYKLNSRAAELYLKNLYYGAKRKPMSVSAFQEALDTLTYKALFDAEKKNVSLRIARHEKSIVVDLADEQGNVVVIDDGGYRVTQSSPVPFIVAPGALPLPLPQAGGSLADFQKFIGMGSTSFHRLVAFILNCFKPEGPYFCLIVEGEQGSGKSYLCQLLKQIVDPHAAPKLRIPGTERDLMIQAQTTHLLLYDNISGIKAEMSDALCALSTGGGFSTRKLYADDELQIFNSCRPYILNGITDIVNRPDLLERSLLLKLEPIKGNKRKTEAEMITEFEDILPKLLGKIFDIVAHALNNYDTTRKPSGIRMADAAKWLLAAEPATGLPEHSLLNAVEASQSEVMVDRLANNSLVIALMKAIEKAPYKGTVGNLFSILETYRPSHDRSFPATAAHLSRALDRIRPALTKIGIEVEFGLKTRTGRPVSVCLVDEGGFDRAALGEGLDEGGDEMHPGPKI